MTLTYTLHNDTKEGAVIDQATKDRPLEGIFGHGMFLPRFEENLQGLEPGDTFGFRLTPAEGYGEFNQEMVYTVKKDMFMDEKGNLSELCKEGNTLQFNVGDGNILPGTIKKVTAELVEIDFNHQLAGETVRYAGVVQLVRDATPEELQPKHHGCGCGCEDCNSDCNHDHNDNCNCGCC